jgi:hypothetical protein
MMLAVDNPERSKFLEERTNTYLHSNPELQPLLDKLLEIDGDYVVLMIEEKDELDKLLNRGRTFEEPARLKKMRDCKCHQNAATLYARNRRRYRVATGYALSDDGVWRQHSWAYDTYDKCVVETTDPRTKYFGYVMTREESNEFEADNW